MSTPKPSLPAPRDDRRPKGYFAQSQDLLNSLVLVLPLLLIYEVGLLTGVSNPNGVDFLTVFLAAQWGATGLFVFNGVLLAAGGIGIYFLKAKGRLNPKIMLPLVIESTVYAIFLGTIILTVMRQLGITPEAVAAGGAQKGLLDAICVSLGAGVNEELVFRLVLFSGIALALGKLGIPRPAAIATAVIVSSILFSVAHYFGPNESFAMFTFVYRFLAGALFCGLFAARGFAVAVYTHAIYDIIVLTF